jgi:hypothetical protein
MAFAVQQLDQRGDYDNPQNAAEGWRSQADLMRLILEYMGKHNGREPAESAVKSHLSKTIQQWRVGQK